MLSRKSIVTPSLAAVISLIMTGLPMSETQAQAQGSRPVLEELTVTARRRDESLMEVPLAISAVDSEAIEAAGLRDIIELSRFTPGLYARVGGNGRIDRANTQLTFRGLSVRSGIFFIDGAPYGGARRPDVTDAARVEVLKGPQSAYFGRSTFSGAVNFVTKNPADTFQGRVRAEAFSYDGTDIQLSAEGPLISDVLGIRLNARHYRFGGFYENGGDPSSRFGEEGTNSITANILYTPTDRLTVRSFLSFSEDDDGVSTAAALKSGVELFCDTGGNQIAPPGGNFYACGALPKVSDLDQRIVISVNDWMDDPTYNALIRNEKAYPLTFDPTFKEGYGMRRHTTVANVGIDYDLPGGFVLNTTTAYAETKTQQIVDQIYRDGRRRPNGPPFTNNPIASEFTQFTLLLQNLVNNFSQEVRISSPLDRRFRYTGGANLFRQWGPSSSNSGFALTGYHNGTAVRNLVSTPAVFGGAYFDVTDAMTIGVEGRYQWDEITQQPTFPNVATGLTETFTSFSPRLTVDYTLGDHLIYAQFARGYQPGGFNAALANQDPFIVAQIVQAGANLTYEQEKLDTYELGLKSTWLDGRLRTTLALYHAQWLDGQVSNQVFPLRPDGSVVQTSVTVNVGRIDLQGLELEADFAATDNLTISASLNVADNEIKEFNYLDGLRIINSSDVTGNQLDQTPKLSWSLSPVYTARLNANYDWFARLDYTGRSKIYVDPTNVAWIEGTNRFNLRAGIRNDTLRLEAYIKNLTNDKTLDEGTRAADVYSTFPPRGNEIRIGLPDKRVFGVSVSYEF